jgi:hypothetical protein
MRNLKSQMPLCKNRVPLKASTSMLNAPRMKSQEPDHRPEMAAIYAELERRPLPAAATSGWQATHHCSPGARLCMQLRESGPAGARHLNHILMGPARSSGAMAAAPSTSTARLAAAPISVPKLVECTRANTSQISFSAWKLWTNASAAVAHARWKPPSVPRWRKSSFDGVSKRRGVIKGLRNPAPASGWPQTASTRPPMPLCHWQATSAPRFHLQDAQTPP